jgi:HSP20 family molecular chaperone IbpA
MPLVHVRQGFLKPTKGDQRTNAVLRRVRHFLTGIARRTPLRQRQGASAGVYASVPSEVKDSGNHVTVSVPILGFTAMELYVIPELDSLTIEGRVTERRDGNGSNWVETIEKRLTHRLHFDFELDSNRITATLNDSTLEIVAHKIGS